MLRPGLPAVLIRDVGRIEELDGWIFQFLMFCCCFLFVDTVLCMSGANTLSFSSGS